MSLFYRQRNVRSQRFAWPNVTHVAESESERSLPDCSDAVFCWGLVLSVTITVLHGA